MTAITVDHSTRMSRLSERRHLFGALLLAFGIVGTLPISPAASASTVGASASVSSEAGDAQAEATAVTEETRLGQCVQGSWLHSMEEDTDETIIYRPADYPFPPARGRIGFELLPGGYLIYHGFGPADEPLLSHGRWEQPARDTIVIQVDEPGQPIFSETWNVASCSEDLLEIAREF